MLTIVAFGATKATIVANTRSFLFVPLNTTLVVLTSQKKFLIQPKKKEKESIFFSLSSSVIQYMMGPSHVRLEPKFKLCS